MRRKKILILVDWFYPGYKAGGPIQSCRNFVAAMGEEYEIFILTGDRDLGDQAAYDTIEHNEWNSYNNKARVRYLAGEQINVKALTSQIKTIAPDFIYLNSMFSFPFTILPFWVMLKNKFETKLVLAPRGMLQEGAMKFKSLKKKLFIRFLNLSPMVSRIHFQATDEQEKKDIIQYFPSAPMPVVATNFPAEIPSSFAMADKAVNGLRIAYVSRITPKKNLHYLLSLLNNLPAEINCQLNIRGEFEDLGYQQQCEKIVQQLPAHVKVVFGGAIQNNLILPFLQQHHIFALTTLGENFGHAIYEALCAGRPVLISNKTPWLKLAEKKAGWDIALDQPQQFLQTLIQIAGMRQTDFNEWCSGAWNLANSYLKTADIKEQYQKLFN
jgi:glycosyltransferase involved in cell wall biosynthesis